METGGTTVVVLKLGSKKRMVVFLPEKERRKEIHGNPSSSSHLSRVGGEVV